MGFATTNDQYASCGVSPSYTPSNQARTTMVHDTYGYVTASLDPVGNTGCTVGTTQYTSCTAYDPTTQAKATSTTNALNQANTSTYSNAADGGWGQWLISSTDANNATTTTHYDYFGRTTGIAQPGETSGLVTQGMTYVNWCSGTAAQTPCVEEDTSQRLDSTTQVTTRSFYDGQHRLVETRSPAPNGQDVVSYTFYDISGHANAQSVKYFVTAYTGGAGAAAYSIPDSTVATSTSTYDGLGRTLTSTNALSEVTTMNYSVVCSPVSGNTDCYEQTLAWMPTAIARASWSVDWGKQATAKSTRG